MKFSFVVFCFLYCVYVCSSHQAASSHNHQAATPPQPSILGGWWASLTAPQATVIIGIAPLLIKIFRDWYSSPKNRTPWSVILLVMLSILMVVLVYWSIRSYIKATPVPVPSAVLRYAQYLNTSYKRKVSYDDRLLKIYSKHYIELGLVSSDSISHEKTNEMIELKDILKPRKDGKPVRCVLVEGALGIGKSTLARELCCNWGKLDIVKQYKLVVLVDLKQKRAQEATCLSDLFIPFENINLEEVISEIGNGEGVLIILDGFDELPYHQQQEGSVYTKLIKHQELLPEATVIITNRPSINANLYLQKYAIDRQLEISGFTAQGIKEFVRNV